jgi:glutamine amidotransferase-like uncharacterized protein
LLKNKNINMFNFLSILFISFSTFTYAACSIKNDALIVVYNDTTGGVGQFSSIWTNAFFDWFSAANPDLIVSYVNDAMELSTYYTTGCQLATYSSLRLYVQPGGDASTAASNLGPGGRDNILDFAAVSGNAYMGTCAGYFYAAGSYWWSEGDEPMKFYPSSWMTHFLPTVEGPIKEIANYPAYAPTELSNGHTMVYYGGPALGYNVTSNTLPDGATLIASYTDPNIPKDIPAMFMYLGQYVHALLNSPHPEAQAGVGLTCQPPFPSGCITEEQQLANWQLLAENINTLVGWNWVIPSTL